MATTILGRKLGMSQVWSEDDRLIPVTVIEAGPCFVSQVKTVKVAIAPEYTQTDSDPDSEFPLGKLHTAWCPLGYKVTGGGFDLRDVLWTLMASKPTANSTGRHGWQVRFDHITGSGGEATAAYVYAQCVR